MSSRASSTVFLLPLARMRSRWLYARCKSSSEFNNFWYTGAIEILDKQEETINCCQRTRDWRTLQIERFCTRDPPLVKINALPKLRHSTSSWETIVVVRSREYVDGVQAIQERPQTHWEANAFSVARDDRYAIKNATSLPVPRKYYVHPWPSCKSAFLCERRKVPTLHCSKTTQYSFKLDWLLRASHDLVWATGTKWVASTCP